MRTRGRFALALPSNFFLYAFLVIASIYCPVKAADYYLTATTEKIGQASDMISVGTRGVSVHVNMGLPRMVQPNASICLMHL